MNISDPIRLTWLQMHLPAHINPLVTEEVSEEEKRSMERYVHYRIEKT
jgi:hypothetical protein